MTKTHGRLPITGTALRQRSTLRVLMNCVGSVMSAAMQMRVAGWQVASRSESSASLRYGV